MFTLQIHRTDLNFADSFRGIRLNYGETRLWLYSPCAETVSCSWSSRGRSEFWIIFILVRNLFFHITDKMTVNTILLINLFLLLSVSLPFNFSSRSVRPFCKLTEVWFPCWFQFYELYTLSVCQKLNWLLYISILSSFQVKKIFTVVFIYVIKMFVLFYCKYKQMNLDHIIRR